MTEAEARDLIRQRKAAQQPAPVAPQEAADVAQITQGAGETPGIVRVAQSALSPSVSLGLAGGLVGGVVGKTPAAARAGGAAGTALGTTLENFIKGESLTGMENVKDVAVNTALSLGGDIVGAKVGKALGRKFGSVGGRLRSKAIGTVTDGAAEVHDIGKELARAAEADIANVVAEGGIPMSPDDIKRATRGIFTAPQLMESQALDQAEAVAKGSFIGQGPIRRMELIRDKTFDAAKNAYKRAVGPYLDDAGKLGRALSSKVEGFVDKTREKTSVLHEFVDQQAGDAPVEISTIRQGLDGAIETLDKIRGATPDPEGMDKILESIKGLAQRATPELDPLTGEVMREAVPFSWREAKLLRTRFRQVAEVAGNKGYNAAAAEARTAVKNLTSVMEEALDDTVPVDAAGRSLRKVWQRANSRTFKTERLVEKAQLEAVFDLADERNLGAQVVDKLAPRLGNAENIKTTRRLLGGSKSEPWKMLQRWRIEGLLNSNTPEKALRTLTEVQQTGPGPAAYREILGEHYDKVVKLLKAQTFAGLKSATGGKVAPHLIETGLVVSLGASPLRGPGASAAALGAAGTWVIGMKQLSKWMTDPKTADMVLGLAQRGKKPSPFVLRQVGRAIQQSVAEGAIGQDDFYQLPETESLEEMRARKSGARQPAIYGGTRG